jgi:hypothetical protein
LGQVAYGNKRFIIQKRDRPLAALVSVEDLERLEHLQAVPASFHWPLALVGAWGDLLEDSEIDSLVEDIYASREKDMGRPVELED